MKCNLNCFNCEFEDDCHNDEISDTELFNIDREDKSIIADEKPTEYKKQIESNRRWRQRNREREKRRNSLNYQLKYKDDEQRKEKVREANRRYKARLRERQAV